MVREFVPCNDSLKIFCEEIAQHSRMRPGGESRRPCGFVASDPLAQWPGKQTPVRVVLEGSANTWIRRKNMQRKKNLEEEKLDGCWRFEDASGQKKVSCWLMEEDGCWDSWRCLWMDQLKARTQEELKKLKNSKNKNTSSHKFHQSFFFFFSSIKSYLTRGGRVGYL